ncbi:MAG: cobyrinate a,c-diamide synthase [Methyloprofundus sp.]|nr:cobyrinate a,c-diamide synthase [Methyloprofundus sp.]
MKIILLAGTHSGCGKTTIMLALLQALKVQNEKLVAFKAGPDFLDPLWHQAVTQRVSYNLDTRMIGEEQSLKIMAAQAETADVAIIEGVMGLFDGRSGVGGSGSSAELAQRLNVPVFLVVDAKGMSGSIVPLVSGFVAYAEKMQVHIAGIIANRVGSVHHAELLRKELQQHKQPPLIAWMEAKAPSLPERHLGLVQPSECVVPGFLPFFHSLENDLTHLFAQQLKPASKDKKMQRLSGKTIAVAQDAACCFIYPANIDFLTQQGADLVYFSPINGDNIPNDVDALWLPGGYPELFARELSVSKTWKSLSAFIESGKPVLAECGGAMILGQSLRDLSEKTWPMANVLPYRSIMQSKLASLGYREEVSGIKGHEFHHSIRETESALTPCFNVGRGDTGVRYKNLRASYNHWYFSSAPDIAAAWFGA